MYTNDMKFVATHEWVRPENNDEVIMGITHHAQELLGDLVYVELPTIGKIVNSENPIGVVESVKAASDLYAPVSGTVIAVNEQVISDPTLLNSSPHAEGWLLKIKLANPHELDKLLNLEAYQKLIG
jgi:glycine cleavage system H protein